MDTTRRGFLMGCSAAVAMVAAQHTPSRGRVIWHNDGCCSSRCSSR